MRAICESEWSLLVSRNRLSCMRRGYEIVYGRGAVGLAEGVDEVVFVDVCELCKLVEAYALLEVLIYVAADDAALAFVAVTGGLAGQGQASPPQYAQKYNLQQPLAHLRIALLLRAHLLQHEPQAAGDWLPIPVKMREDVALLIGGHFQVLYAEHYVLHRTLGSALLAVHNARVYYDQAVAGDRETVVLQLKNPAAAQK